MDELLGPDFAEKIKAPTLINVQIFDKFRTDVVTLTVLQKLVEDKEKELQNLTSKKEVTDFASKQIWIWVYLQILLIINVKKLNHTTKNIITEISADEFDTCFWSILTA